MGIPSRHALGKMAMAAFCDLSEWCFPEKIVGRFSV
jgi:hypothetical protein